MNSEKLSKVRETYKEYKELKDKIREYESMRISPRIAVYGAERVQTSMRGDIQPDTIAKVDRLLVVYNARLQECAELIIEFEQALEVLTKRQRRLMRYYYTEAMTWEQVCFAMDLSWTTLHRIRRAALAKLLKADGTDQSRQQAEQAKQTKVCKGATQKQTEVCTQKNKKTDQSRQRNEAEKPGAKFFLTFQKQTKVCSE